MTAAPASPEDRKLRGGPLSSLRVLDLSGPHGAYASRLLRDLGAEVLRIDPPARPETDTSPGRIPQSAALERHLHAGKRRIALDLSVPEDRGQLLRLLEAYDVLIESAPPGQLERWGIAYPDLARVQPRLIQASVTGFGRSGPYAGYRCSDLIAAAMGGQMHVCGDPEGPPLAFHGRQAGFAASLQAAAGILVAVNRRRRTGRGSCFEVSLQEAVASGLDHVLVRYFADGAIAGRTAGRHWNDLFCIVPSADGWMQITPFLMWDTLVDLMGQEGLSADLTEPCWGDEAYRHAHADHAIAMISRWTGTHSSDHLFELGQALRMPWAPVVTPATLRHCPQLQARDFLRNTAYPYRFSSFEHPAQSPVRGCGQDPLEDIEDILRDCLPAASPTGSKPKSPPPGENGAASPAQALEGLRILDFTRVLAGPYATRMLADFGAEVIKVQSHLTATGAESPDAPYFAAWNRNKRSITLDLSRPQARDLIRRLIPLCDAVIENFSRRVMAHWQLDYAHLAKLNPALVMVSMSGMGHTGPWKDAVAYGPTVEALAGITCAASQGRPAPVGLGAAYADSISGLYGVTALLAALEWRRDSGRGQHIDLSEYEAMASLLGPDLAQEAAPRQAGSSGAQSCTLPPQQFCLPCQGEDRWCALVLHDDRDWAALCGLAAQAAWAEDARFKTGNGRLLHAQALQQQLGTWSRTRDAHSLMSGLQDAGLAAGVVQNAADLASDPHLVARGFFVDVNHPAHGRFRSDRSPIRFLDEAAQEHQVRGLGDDNRHVFQTLLGLEDAAFERLVADKVIW